MSVRGQVKSARDLPCVTPIVPESYRGDQPEDFASWGWGDWREVARADATWVILDLTVFSDYSGSTVERSNCEALQEDYPDVFTEIRGGAGTRGLMLPADYGKDSAEDSPERYLLQELAALADYPLYSEDHHGSLEMRIAEEMWDAFLRSDVRRGLEEAGVAEVILDATSDERLRGMFYADTYQRDYGPECEDAVSAYFPFFEDTVAVMAAELVRSDEEQDR